MYKVAGLAMTAFASSTSATATGLENEALFEMLEGHQGGSVDAVFNSRTNEKAEYFQRLMAMDAANPLRTRTLKKPIVMKKKAAEQPEYDDEEWEWIECESDDDSPDCVYYDEEEEPETRIN